MYPIYYAIASMVAVLLSLHRVVHIPDYLNNKIFLITANDVPTTMTTDVSTVDRGSVTDPHTANPGILTSSSSTAVPLPTYDKLDVFDGVLFPIGDVSLVEEQLDYILPTGMPQTLPRSNKVHNDILTDTFLLLACAGVCVVLHTWFGFCRLPRQYVSQADSEDFNFMREAQHLKADLMHRLDVLHLLVDDEYHEFFQRLRMEASGYRFGTSDPLHPEITSPKKQSLDEFDLQRPLWRRLRSDIGAVDYDDSSLDLPSDTPGLGSVMVSPLAIAKSSSKDKEALEEIVGLGENSVAGKFGPPFL